MPRLGIDYGTTNTVVVSGDRGHYPIVPHAAETAVGPVTQEMYPSLALRDRASGAFLFGHEAARAAGRPGAEERYDVIRSPKRLLRDCADGVRLGAGDVPGGFDAAELIGEFCAALRESILGSGLFPGDEPLESVLTVPANANGAQRHLMRRCFSEAGFDVQATINEPTASAIEFADRLARGNRAAARRVSSTVAVFDLGGGTFDVSLVGIDGPEYTVVDSAGIERLGGDDFDEVLARLFAERLGIDLEALRPFQRHSLLAHCRQQKESISSGALRSLTLAPGDIGLPGETCAVPVEAYFDALTPLLAPALDRLTAVVGARTLDAVYLVGGSSRLPLVATLVASRLPEAQLISSDKPFSTTAMGAAIRAAEGVRLNEILARTFGVIRLTDAGQREFFDPVFPAGTKLPQRGGPALERTLRYTPRHNIGRLRYLECAQVDDAGRPSAGIRTWSEALFPYDPSIPVGQALAPEQIELREDLKDKPVTEQYTCDSDGVLTVRIVRQADGQSRTYEIFRG